MAALSRIHHRMVAAAHRAVVVAVYALLVIALLLDQWRAECGAVAGPVCQHRLRPGHAAGADRGGLSRSGGAACGWTTWKNRAVLAVLNAYTWVVAGAVVLWSVYILFGVSAID